MPSIKDLKKRISSVKNTQQTTRAMKMVSAAKLRRAQEAITNQRPYAQKVSGLIRTMAGIAGDKYQSPLIRTAGSEPVTGKVLLVVVTSDRGLCGGFNSSVIKAAQRWVMKNGDRYTGVKMSFVGRRGHDFFKNRKIDLGQYYVEAGGKVTFQKARKLADSLVAEFLTGEYAEIKFIYNEFKNAVTQKVVVEDFLPVEPPVRENTSGALEDEMYIVKPAAGEVLSSLLDKNFAVQAFRILLESQAGEHGARMSAMENATKNAGEMIRKLSLQYNKQRQANITKELLEIISGSESQKS